MKICVAQTRPVRGDIRRNVDRHKELIGLAVSGGADVIIFPELSITGYEPELAKELATSPDDQRFDDFQKMADSRRVTIGIGVPLKHRSGVNIGLVIFHPHRPRQIYAKKYLHSDEEEFFTGGQNPISWIDGQRNIALAICYELSVPEHAEDALQSGSQIYAASVAKTADGIEKAAARLSEVAQKYSMTALLANCLGPCGGFEAAGKSAIWNDRGELVAQLDGASEGVLVLDTDTQRVIEKTL